MDISEDLQKELESIIDHFDNEDLQVRQRQIAFWKKIDYFWNNIQRIYWNGVAHDWRIVNDEANINDDSYYYDKPINIFRAYLETIISALASVVPNVRCFPEDSRIESDVNTAKGGDKISQLIYEHIDAPLKFTQLFYTYCLQGMIAVYNYSKSDESYGTVSKPKIEDVTEDQTKLTCPLCGMQITPVDQLLSEQEEDEYDPGDDDSVSHSYLNKGKTLCINCLNEVDPEISKEKVIVTRITGKTEEPKTRQCVEVYGGLFVKVPVYARTAEECPYLRLSYEQHYTKIMEEFPDLDITEVENAAGVDKPFERWGRLSAQYLGQYPEHTPTVNRYWLRPYTFNMCKDEAKKKELFKKFPDGAYIVMINDLFCKVENQSLDDHWSISKNPLSNYLHYDPHGALVLSVQEITNDLISLSLQTVEQGIGQTFVETGLLDLEAYRNSEATVGGVYPVRPRAGKPIEQSFFQLNAANLGKEVEVFGNDVQNLGQFVSGAMPSLSGAPQAPSARTAGQYSISRNQSLQRLNSPWKMITALWKEIFGKVIPAYIKDMLEDDIYVTERDGSFLTTVIEKMQLDGKIGRVELDCSDQPPVSPAVVKETLMNLMQLNNPEIMSALILPENVPILAKAIGLSDFVIPAEADREKQNEEIQVLVKARPMPTQNGVQSSIQPEPLVDNHAVEAEICRKWLVGEEGRLAKIQNPNGYQNVLLHLKAHIAIMNQMKSAFPSQPPMPAKGAPAPPKPSVPPSGVNNG